MEEAPCPLCGQPAELRGSFPTGDRADPLEHRWNCQTCGRFRIRDRADANLERDPSIAGRKFLLSAYVRDGNDIMIDDDVLGRVGSGDLRERTVPEKVDLILRWFAKGSPEYGHEVSHEAHRCYPIGWCRSPGEWSKLVAMLVKDRQHLDTTSSGSICKVTFKGWEWLGDRPKESATTAFVAMSFAPEHRALEAAICEGIGNAGYAPKVVRDDVYAGGVMDRVLALIREARFVVADYTDNRGGVYYEAGFALGLGKLVIHSCRQDQLDPTNTTTALHFDVKHLKILPWQKDQVSKHTLDLENHIVALLGRGPLSPGPSQSQP